MTQFLISVLLLLASGASFAQQYAVVTPFPAPKNLTFARDGITLADFDALRAALDADPDLRNAQHGPPDYSPSQFGHLTVFSVDLGPLGRGMVVYFNHSEACGATGNCPMALYIRRNAVYDPALHFGGWGFWITPAPGAPHLVSAWNMSCCDEIYTRYRYSNGHFVPDACVEETNPDADDPDKTSLKACQSGASSHTFTPPANIQSPGPGAGPTYNDLRQLRTVAEPDVNKISSVPFSNLPVVALPHWLVLVVADRSRGTRLFVYPRVHGRIAPAVLCDIAGDDVAEVETDQRQEVPPHALVPKPALIIARRRGPRMDMTLYSEPGSDPRGLPPNGKMVAEACEQIMPRSGASPATWNPDALRVHAVPCDAAPGAIPVANIDGTLVSKAEQDGSGQVWGITPGLLGRLVRWDDQWQPSLGPVPNATPALGPGPDGGVLVGWGSGTGRLPQWLDGDTIRPFTSHNNFGPNTLRLANGGALLTSEVEIMRPRGESTFWVKRWPALSILANDGQEIAKYNLQADQFEPAHSGSNSQLCVASFATLAAGDTTWIWTPSWRDCLGLRGFLTTDGRSFNYVPKIGGLPNAQLSTLGRWPGDRLAAAVPGDGIYLIDPAAHTAQRLAPPAPETFQHVAAVLRAGNDGYVVAEGDCKPAAKGQACDPVWRWRHGEWQLVIPALDTTPDVPCWILTPQYCTRPVAFVENARGVWLGGVGSGLWLIAPSSDAKQFTSRTGFPLSTVTQLFPLTDGSILAIDADHARSFAFRASRSHGTR